MSDEQLTAAECAARTGLTARALRVYERYGLIDPPRTPRGWRCYGRAELTRLNTISVLKSVGLALAQIGEILARKAPPLEAILRAQAESWKRKKEEVERGQCIVDLALARVRADHALSVDELCNLIRGCETIEISPALRHALREMLALPVSERAAWAERHNEQANPAAFHEFQEAVVTLINPQLEKLMDDGVPPSSAQAQGLVAQHLQLMARYHIREAAVRWLAKRPRMPQLKQRPTQASDVLSSQWPPNPFVVEYFAEAESQSEQCLQLDELLRDAHRTGAGALVERLRSLCDQHTLGDPLAFARWAALARPPPSSLTAADDAMIWNAIAESLAARQGAVSP